MTNIGWNESNPPDTESAGLGDDRIRSLTTSVRMGMAAEHTWPSAGGDAGIHLLGSARAYVGSQSQVSSSGTDGRLMWTSDSSKLFHVGSGGSVYLGGPTGISLDHGYLAFPQRHQWVEEVGITAIPTGSSQSVTVVIPNSGYSGVPYLWLTENDPADPTTLSPGQFKVFGATTGTFKILQLSAGGAGWSVCWRSLGTRAL